VEFSNRVVAALTVLTTLVLMVVALCTRGLSRRVKVLSCVVFVGTLAQAPLGAITVHYHLNPRLVIAHLLLSLAVLGVGVLIAVVETQYRLYDRIPWWVVLLQVTVAAGLFAWTVGLVGRLWRPVRN